MPCLLGPAPVTGADPPEVHAVDCPRSFVFMSEGGVRAVYACGGEAEWPEEQAVDVVVLQENVSRKHHHHHLPHLHR